MNFNKKIKLQKWVDNQIKKGVRQKKRSSTPSMTNYYGWIIK